jgi:general secretion pathway protein G
MAKPSVSKLNGVKPGGNLRKSGGNNGPFSIRVTKPPSAGFTLIELMAATAIALMLFTLAIPLVRVTVQRERERELRRDLWDMRDAIDRYKDAADRGMFQIKVGSEGYPPDLDTLVKGVDVGVKKYRFLRRIPVDPMTGKNDWGMRSMQDDADSDSWGGQNLFDVFTKSERTALDGTQYKQW